MDEARIEVPIEGEAPVNPYSLLEAVNASSDTVNTGWLIFIAIMSYLLVSVAGVTHRDLLLARDIPLPILQVGIELTRFFLFAPIVLVLFHLGVVTQLVMLARKALELDRALRIVEATDRRTHPLRLELNNFFFVQAIAGPERSRVVGGVLHGLSWLTLVVLPVLLLLYVQVVFLPYHDVAITWAHRIALLADIGVLALIGVFLTRPEQSLLQAFLKAVRAHPLSVLLTIVVLSAVAAFSLLIATVPGERLDRLGRELLTGGLGPASYGNEATAFGFIVPFPMQSADGKLFGLFERNLNVTDHDLVIDKDVTPGETTLNLRGRDLRYARLDRSDLHQADLTGVNLDGASLVGSDLRGAVIHCADINRLLLTESRSAAACPSARNANFTRAKLAEASLVGIDLEGARLEEADLAGSRLSHANLADANFYSARLERADLTGGLAMQGSNLATAVLQGADLTGAKLQGADLTSAAMQGALLDFASLDGASLRDADLEGASLYQARLAAADLSGASIRAASLRDAYVWRARPPDPAQSELADLTGLRSEGPSRIEAATLEAVLQRIGNAQVQTRVREAVGLHLVASDGSKPLEHRGGAGSWSDVLRHSQQDGSEPRGSGQDPPIPTGAVLQPVTAGGGGADAIQGHPAAGSLAAQLRLSDRRSRLTRHLVNLACKSRWADGGVATGVAKRALSPAFNGDPSTLLEGLRRPECTGARAIPPATLARLATAVDTLRAK